MSLTVDTFAIEENEWVALPVVLPTADDWLYALWGIRVGTSSPTSQFTTVHPACTAAAAWLRAMWALD